MSLDLFKKLFGAKLVEDGISELTKIRDINDARWEKNFEDNRAMAEILKEMLERLEKLEKKKLK